MPRTTSQNRVGPAGTRCGRCATKSLTDPMITRRAVPKNRMDKMFKKALILTCLLAGPALAGDDPAQDNMLSGLSACAIGVGSATAIDTAITSFKWTKKDGDDGAIAYFAPVDPDNTRVVTTPDGSYCHVESAKIGVEAAKAMTQAVLESMGIKGEQVKTVQDEFGCDGLDLGNGITVSAVSGGDKPTCEGADSSTVIFKK